MARHLYILPLLLLVSCIASNKEAISKYEEIVNALDNDSLSAEHQQLLKETRIADSITTLSDDFFAKWQKVSENLASQHVNPTVDSLYQRAFDCIYNGNYPYIVISPSVTVSIYDAEYSKDDYSYKSHIVSERRYLPHLRKDKPVLYLFESVNNQLSSYLGGINDDTGNSINRERAVQLNQYIEVNYGHWGGYWHLASMPIIFEISVFRNGVWVRLRDSWHTGQTLFMPNDSNDIQNIDFWIE